MRGLLWLRNAATEAGAAPFLMAQVATECWNLPGLKARIPAAVQATLMASVYFSKLNEPRSSSRFLTSSTSADTAVRKGCGNVQGEHPVSA